MILDEVTGKQHPDFCSEYCSVGFGEMDERHRSAGFLASRGGPIGDKPSPFKPGTAIDLVPSVSLERASYRDQVEVVITVNAWITDHEGWTIPPELQGHGGTYSMAPERAEHLAELLIEHAKTAREAMAAASEPAGSAA